MENILEISDLSKKFRSNYALKNISLSLGRGEILGLVGANGSGKTTLMNILAGNPVIADTGGFTGEIKLGGRIISPAAPSDSLKLGIGMVYQEFALIPSFTAPENIMLGKENLISPVASLPGLRIPLIDHKKNIHKAESILSSLGVNGINIHVPVTEFNVSTRQFVEFARVINSDTLKLLILDEPTAVLGRDESIRLMDEVRKMADKGISVIFISHRLEEILSLCHRIAVLRDGILESVFTASETSAEDIARCMLGSIHARAIKTHNHTSSGDSGNYFRIKNMNSGSGGESLRNFSLNVSKGEIIGITGQSGQGQMLLGKSLMGLIPSDGEISIDGEKIQPGDTASLFRSGFYYIPEERRRDGLLPEHSIADNITFTKISTKRAFTSRTGLLNFKSINETVLKYTDELDIKCAGIKQKVCELSGGNQQKVILARALLLKPEIMMIFEPTRGIDIGAKEMILNMLLEMNREMQTTIIIVSSELEELLRVCDRIAVLYEGSIFSVLTPELPEEKFIHAFAGRAI
jgi:simple sugar transport system ATP-binding protein